jgi:murein DD-endopeptidase MepM/ murein hydrolase activator NlpD
MADQKGIPVHDLGLQLDYMWSELEGPYKEVALDPLMQATDLETAVRIWQDHYEVGANFEPRMASATDYLAQYGSGTAGVSGVGSSTGGCGGGSNGQVVGGYSLPVDRHFYDEHPDWFKKPHHSGEAADIPVPEATPIYSMSDGTIIAAPTNGDCGLGLEIEGPNGVRFIYCHGSDGGSIDGARQGDQVKAGQLIMHSSYTGHVDPPGPGGSHLHLGIRIGGDDRCPQTLFVGIAEGKVPDIMSLPTSDCSLL